MGRLTTHVLDTASGIPARGVAVALIRIEGDDRRPVANNATDTDGRLDAPLLAGDAMRTGTYELVFAVGDYFRSRGMPLATPAFLDEVVVRFAIADEHAHYHVPLLVSPWSYTTYRGS